MSARLNGRALDELRDLARAQPLARALARMTAALAGREGYLLWRGHALLPSEAGLPLVDAAAAERAPGELTLCDDPLAEAHGLRLAVAAGDEARGIDAGELGLCVLALRCGLALRILDMSHRHLAERWSFGKKTLSHQLVKASFSTVHAGLEQLREQARLRLEQGWLQGLEEEQRELSELTGQAEKLMGGHGYLQDGSHGVSYLSMLLYSVYGAECEA